MKQLLFVLLTICIIPVGGRAASLEEEYKRKERCEISAKEFFKEQYGSEVAKEESGTWIRDYANHYNQKLNTCFLWVREIYSPGNKSEKGLTKYNFYNVNKNALYGSLIMDGSSLTEPETFHSCSFLIKDCHSKSEWEKLIKPYMEE